MNREFIGVRTCNGERTSIDVSTIDAVHEWSFEHPAKLDTVGSMRNLKLPQNCHTIIKAGDYNFYCIDEYDDVMKLLGCPDSRQI